MRYELPEFDLDAYVPYRLAVAATQLSKGLAEQYRQRFGISITEWRVLVNVGYSDKTSVRDIEHRVSLDKSKVSRAATRLEAAGYVIKSVDETDPLHRPLYVLTSNGTVVVYREGSLTAAVLPEVEILDL